MAEVTILNRCQKKIKTERIRSILKTALEDLGQADFELSVLLTDDEGIRSLNRKFRKIDSSTDVLSFPMHEEGILGDIAISIPTAIEQARAESLPLDEEITLLLIHGLLHLLGHDHEKSETDARRMHEEEKRLLRLVTN